MLVIVGCLPISSLPEDPVLIPAGNISKPMIGPAYSVSSLSILGPRVYNVREWSELALVCRVVGGGDPVNLYWRRKVVSQGHN